MDTPTKAVTSDRPSFTITRADGTTVTLRGTSLPDALHNYYENESTGSAVVAIARVNDAGVSLDEMFVFGIDVRELADLSADLVAILVENENFPSISIDADGSDWALRVLVEELPSDAPLPLRTYVAQELDGNWNHAFGSQEQMNALAADWIGRQQELHPGLIILGP